VRAHADRVLVTCGGSDPNRWTLAILHGLEAVEGPLELRVVVGPMFDPALRDEIEAIAAGSAHRVALVKAPQSLLAHMQWCDLAIATSGLTKYELAATATPVLMFSIDALHDATNRAFSTMGSAVDLGVGITAEQIASEARSLLADQKRRAAMAAAGRAMVDGRGTERLIAEVMKDVDAA
jgi:UDP-2,4-diacetamido-2,4,6-trideoxy-beta-L-altropyranose hydrolase